MVKKLFGYILVLIIIFANAVIVNAETQIGELNFSTNELHAGDTFSVILKLDYDDEITGLKGLKFNYNSSALDLVSQEINDSRFSDAGSDETGLYLYTNSAEIIKSTEIYKLTFKVKENVVANTNIQISTTDFSIYNNLAEEIQVNGIENNITVVEQQDTPSGEEPGGDTTSGETPSGETPSGQTPSGEKTDSEQTNGKTPDTTKGNDTTTSKKDLSNTGLGIGLGSAIVIVIGAGVFGYIKYRKYNNI